ncbi:MAG: dipeptide epimerase [Bacteroidota bacterium]
MKLKLLPVELPLRDPFRISHGVRTHQPTIIVRLEDEAGRYGLGEAPMTSYYGLDSDRCLASLRNFAPRLEGWIASSQSELEQLQLLAKELHPFLRCALDVAAHDYWAKTQNKRVGECWLPGAKALTPTCYTIGLDSIPRMVEKLQAFPWPVYKIKLGTEQDLAIIKALRQVTDAPFQVDANTGWTYERALQLIPQLAQLGVEFIEQPLPADAWEAQRRLRERIQIPILADESCQTAADIPACAEAFDGINIKITKAGGLLASRRMITQARALGLQVMAGCMTESSVGISANAQLLPELDYADFDGAMLLAKDPAKGVSFGTDGLVRWPDRPGTGAELRTPWPQEL